MSPQSLEEGDRWKVIEGSGAGWINTHLNGITYQRSEVTPAMIEDGLSNTYLYGEKFIPPDSYTEDSTGHDDQSLYIGFSLDNLRMCGTEYPPNRDTLIEVDAANENFGFGSVHPTGLHMALCDGSVRKISYDIDVEVHSAMSTRAGGEIDLPKE